MEDKTQISPSSTSFNDVDENLILVTTQSGEVKLIHRNGQLLWRIISVPKAISAHFFGNLIIIKYANKTKEYRDYAGNMYVSIPKPY